MSRRPALPVLTLAATAAALAAGCARMAPVTEAVAAAPARFASGTASFFQNLFSTPQSAVEVVEIGRSAYCNSQGRESAVDLFTRAADLVAWETARGVQLTPVTASLPPGTYAIVEMGERNTGGYGLAVSRQGAQSNGTLYLKASYLNPKTSGMASQAITAPCALVAVQSVQTFAGATLLDQSNKVRATWTLADAATPVGEAPRFAPATVMPPLTPLPASEPVPQPAAVPLAAVPLADPLPATTAPAPMGAPAFAPVPLADPAPLAPPPPPLYTPPAASSGKPGTASDTGAPPVQRLSPQASEQPLPTVPDGPSVESLPLPVRTPSVLISPPD